jgi:hypothetical protein
MKRIFTLLLVLAAVAVNAQSIKLFNGDAPLNNNDTIFMPFSETGDQVDVFMGYMNTTSNDLVFRVSREIIFESADADISFCINGDCYTSSSSLSRPIPLDAEQTIPSSDELAFHAIFYGSGEPSLVKYTLFNVDNESDCVSIYIYYGVGVGLKEADMVKVLRAFPNPAVKTVNIDFAAPERNASLVIKNLTGKEVYRTPVNNVGRKQVDVTSFSPGVYFYGVESDGRMLCTKKLLVK